MNQTEYRQNLVCGAVILFLFATAGCSTGSPRWVDQSWSPIAARMPADSTLVQELAGQPVSQPRSESGPIRPELFPDSAVAIDQPPGVVVRPPESPTGLPAPQETPGNQMAGSDAGAVRTVAYQETVRAQDEGYGSATPYPLSGQPGAWVPPAGDPRAASPPQGATNGAIPWGTQYGNQQTGGAPGTTTLPPQIGSPNEVSPYFQPTAPPVDNFNYADIDVMLSEAQTGRMTFGAAYNSNSGLVGQIIIDERNFDITAFPRSLDDIVSGRAWRGGGQGFRLELVPGSDVQRYAVSFDNPYLFNSDVSFSASGYYFDRRYFDWSEQRLGGRFALGYRLTPDLSVSVGLRAERVTVFDPRVGTSPTLNAALGNNSLYLGSVRLINDTRDHPFMASEGSYLEMAYHQGFGDFSYPRGDIDFRKYFLIYQRPDLSGRHTLSFQTRLGFSGTDTPIFENYFAGGFSTLRGFSFRGASPVEGDVRVGGQFQWLNTVEYTFPITADDMFKGVLFCDYGTIEQDVRLDWDNYRVAPGFGFRVHMPVGGAGGAPLAFDFAFPVNDADTDDRQVFSFYMGVLR